VVEGLQVTEVLRDGLFGGKVPASKGVTAAPWLVMPACAEAPGNSEAVQ